MSISSHRLSEFFYAKYLRAAEKLIVDYNETIAPLVSSEGNFCKKGCSACCASPFWLSQAEVDVIAHYLAENRNIYISFLEGLESRLDIFRRYKEDFRSCYKAGEDGELAAKVFLKIQAPCAFLDKNHLCTVYHIRPVVCSTYYSIVPSRFCSTEPKSAMSQEVSRTHNEVMLAIKKLLKSYKIKNIKHMDASYSVALRLKQLGFEDLPDLNILD